MAAHAFIAIKTGENKYKSVYCHFDGYLDGVGRMLHNHYKNETKVHNLIEMGDMSFLAEDIHPKPGIPHNFQDYQKGVTVFYGRDRGEINVQAKRHHSREALVYDVSGHHSYLFEDGEWHKFHNDGTTEPLRKFFV